MILIFTISLTLASLDCFKFKSGQKERFDVFPILTTPIRLVGSNQCSGRVEIYSGLSWGTVCDDNWDMQDAEVVCRQLNCGSALRATPEASFGQGRGEIWLDDVGCTGSENSLDECSHAGFGEHNCNHGEDAGVICADGQIRLAGGSNRCSGRVEVYNNNIWGTVCDDLWDMQDAEVVCRQLHCGSPQRATIGASFGEGSDQIWLDDVDCRGSESSLAECRHRGFGEHNCGHREDAGVVCSDVQIRLAGGSNRCSGRVEVYNNNSWGTICDDGWDIQDAEVICRQLSCGTAQNAKTGASFGQGSGPIWLDDVSCTGSENSLADCSHRKFGEHNCNHGEDAGVICSDLQIRLAGGSNHCSGRVEIYYGTSWGTVCDDNWDIQDAEVVCQQVRCGSAQRATTQATFGQGSGHIWLDDVGCTGSENSLAECQHKGLMQNNCDHSEDAGVICSDVQIRLVGSDRCAGRVEVYNNNTWGTVCDDDWDIQDAEVVCRQVNCGMAKNAITRARFGQGSSQIWLDNVGCTGSENSLVECSHRGFGQHNCNHGEDAGAVCSMSLPKPRISMNPVGNITWGNNVGISCLISTSHLGGTFTLIKTSGSLRKTQTSSSNSTTFTILSVNFSHEGFYQCQYETTISNQQISSPLSDSVRISVTVSLPKPSISMNPVGNVTWGNNVGISCSISTPHLGGTFILVKTAGSVRKTQTSSSNSATFTIPSVDFTHEGLYQCQYETTVSNQQISSPLSESIIISVTVRLPKPRISMNPVGVVTWGNNVDISCIISTQHLGGTFILMNTAGSIRKTQTSSSNSAHFTIFKVTFDNEGLYHCQYETRVSNRNISSPPSESVRISVAVSLPKPSISMNPVGVVTWGNNVGISCTISTLHLGGTFILMNTAGSMRKTQTSSSNSAHFTIFKVTFDNEGLYHCQYGTRVSNRNISSPPSESVRISVAVSLPKPSISMNPVGVVTWGDNVGILCSISTPHLGGTFILLNTAGSMRKTQTSSSNSANFTILKVHFDNEGHYQCQYDTRVSNRNISSPLSETVRISVAVRLPKPSISINPVGDVMWGNNVRISCSVSTQHLGGTFILMNTAGSMRKTQTSSSNSADFTILKVTFENEGLYQCQYGTRVSNRNISSPLSEFVRISVAAILPKPSISMNPVGVVTWGGDVGILCSISTEHLGGTFILMNTVKSIRKTQRSSSNSANFTILKVNFDNEGLYQCRYETRVSNRNIISPQSESVRIAVAVSLPKPSISMSPVGDVTWGNNVGMSCSISTSHLGGTFILVKTAGSVRKTQTSSSNSITFTIPSVDFTHEGLYQCQYETTVSNQQISSPLSDSIRISVTVSLPKPSISMDPVGVVTWGNNIGILCSISTPHLGGTFILINTAGSMRKTQTSSSNSASFTILKVAFDNEGLYQCQYETRVSNRNISSPLSESVRISVVVNLPKPRISVNPVGDVTWGDNVGISCSISTKHLRGTFILKQTTGSMTMNQTSSSNSAKFTILSVDFDHEGLYQCCYETRISNRNVQSPLSESVTISVAVSLPKPSISMNPVGVITWGNNVGISCTISTLHLGGTFILMNTAGSMRKTQTSHSNSANFTIFKVTFENEGLYQCQYEITVSNQNICSPLSEFVRISVAAILPKPRISMNPIGVIAWGNNVDISCTISTHHFGGTFILTKTEGSMRRTQKSSSNSANFTLLKVNFDNEGLYQCCYETRISNRNIISPQSESVRISVAVSLPKPIISMNPTGIITWGDDVGILCSISTEHLGGTFILMNTAGSMRKTQTSSSDSANFTIINVAFDNEGLYHCQYKTVVSNRNVTSPVSEPVRISITVRLPKPSISMNPGGAVTWGDNVVISCSVSTQHLGGTFILTNTAGSMRKTQTSSSNSANFTIFKVTLDNEGLYQCQYETRVSDRIISSPQSESVRISVAVSLPKPSITMTPGGTVTWGNNVGISCSVSTQHLGGTFILMNTAGSIRKTLISSSNSANFTIHKVTFDHEGLYQCQYETRVSNQNISSPPSDFVRISLAVSLVPLISSVTASLGLISVLVFVVVCLICKRKQRNEPDLQLQSLCEVEKKEVSMNADPVGTQKKQSKLNKGNDYMEEDSESKGTMIISLQAKYKTKTATMMTAM
ncbi:immunoglobulin superfamily member 1-like [Thalassophryne amazonica]|uniref:immunoglobulin superfamily member 1-like n=1 Tax=Thalassophryne amazonica TaxID=390379 RepID=UPI0014712873|nr:immunoglobulin superfamily member 1-like [Thalassophryne amazonica]